MPNKLWISAAFVLALVGPPDVSAAPKGKVTVDVWDTDRGLPQNSVITMTQTRDGYLWLGTMNGLVRFDGLERLSGGGAGLKFPTFDESNTPELRSSTIVKLYEDSHTNLWIGTDAGGVVLARGGGALQRLDIESGNREGRLSSVCEDAAGSVWLYTANGWLYRWANDHLDRWPAGTELPSRCRVVMVESGLLWVGTDWSLTARPLPSPSVTNLPPAFSVPIGKLDFLLPSAGGGYWRLANGRVQKWKGERLQRDLGSYPWRGWRTPINAACEDAEGNLVVGTGGEGIFWFNPDGTFTQFSSVSGGLSHNTILSLCVDHEGNLWAGTDGGGLDRIKQQLFSVLEESSGFTVQSASEDAQGRLWIGYNGERIDCLDKGKVEQFTNAQGLIELNVKAVFADRQDRVWAGTTPRGLLQLQNGLFLSPPGWERFAGMPDVRSVSAVYQDHSNRVWVGTQGGLVRWDGTDWRLFTTRDGLSANVVRCMVEDRDGCLWVGTQGGGLNRIREGEFSTFGRTNGLPSDNVSALCIDEDGVIWAGTSSGLARVKSDSMTSLAGKLSLGGASIGYLLDDRNGHLWIGSNSGLVRASRKDLNDLADGARDVMAVRVYGKAEGLPTQECSQGSQPAACRGADGQLWFPTIKGLVLLEPSRLTQNLHPPPVVIEAVTIDGRMQTTNTLRAPPAQLVTVPPRRESLEFFFTVLNLSAPTQGSIRYRLEGHETAWTEAAATVRSARYSKLPPGRYRFQVIACNEDGVWNKTGASLAVTVLPPFWQTWWFITLVSVCVLGALVAAVHYASTQRLQRQLAALRQKEALERERARIARDLHDQLGANLTQVALLGEMAEADKALPAEVESHAKMISATARDTTRALDEIVWTVNPSNDTLDGLVNYICKYAQEYLALAGLRYRLETPPQLPAKPISPELRHNVFLASKEAVNNVVKHAQATSAWVRLELGPGEFTVEIEDDGRGLGSDAANKGRNGLKNMRKRMEDIGGRFEAVSRAEGGTRVRLTAPLERPNATGNAG